MEGEITEQGDTSPEGATKSRRLMCVLRNVPSKGSYVFTEGAVGSYQPYFILFFKSIGLPISHAGILVAFRTFVSCVSMQCCSAIGRYTRYNRYFFWLASFLSVLTFVPMPWVASSKVLNLSFPSNCTTSAYVSKYRTRIGGSHDAFACDNNTTQIYALFFVMMSMNVGNSAIQCIIPGYSRPVIKSVVENFGQTFDSIQGNLYNAIGYGSAALISGISTDYYKTSGTSQYTAIFFVYLGFSILMIATSVFLYEQFTTNPEYNEVSYRMILQVCCRLENVLFIATVTLIGVANGLICSFLCVILDDMNGTPTLMGVSVLISSTTEFLVFLLANKIRMYLRKPLRCICACLFQYFLRFLCISYMTKSWMIVPIQMLNLFGFPLFWIALVEYIRMISPAQSVDSMCNLMYTFHFTVGGVTANILGGVLYDNYQGKVWLRWMAYVYLLWFVILIVYVFRTEKTLQQREFRVTSFSSQNNLASHPISEIKDKILLEDEIETAI